MTVLAKASRNLTDRPAVSDELGRTRKEADLPHCKIIFQHWPVDPEETEARNDCAGEDQQQFNRPIDRPTDSLA
jgi:hypothetical protein